MKDSNLYSKNIGWQVKSFNPGTNETRFIIGNLAQLWCGAIMDQYRPVR